ncbi:hypothetical protein [Streptomyces nojiriensis]|uniref:hypothetical protein n=1 Tax=Streptomyces nojiriensis TaxID=66374 RepID=UPI00366048DF
MTFLPSSHTQPQRPTPEPKPESLTARGALTVIGDAISGTGQAIGRPRGRQAALLE